MSNRPEQPAGHDTRCPCILCDEWASDLLDWEQEEIKNGRDPWEK